MYKRALSYLLPSSISVHFVVIYYVNEYTQGTNEHAY